jgi:hypothetical protein
MPVRQGHKWYCQLLLDLNRYTLLEELAAKRGKKVTALIRDLVYLGLQTALPPDDYKAAEEADAELWAESVRRRVQGRMRSRELDS